MADVTVKKDKTMLYVAIYLLIVAVFFVLPPPAPLTQVGMKVIGVFFAAIFGWTVTTQIWPTLLTLIFMPLIGLIDMQGCSLQVGVAMYMCLSL